jgi:hypothetical protein
MDADQNDQNLPSATPSPPGFFRVPAELPGQILEHVGFSYKPPEDPLEAAHKREMATSKEQFRQRLVMIVLGVTIIIALLVTGACGYIALFDKDPELRKNAITALAGIIGTLFGAVLGLNGAKLLGADEKKDKD